MSRFAKVAAFALATGLAAATSQAALLLADFKQDATNNTPEVAWTGSTFDERPGAIGDGTITAGNGLLVGTPYAVAAPGAIADGNGGTLFRDATLIFTGGAAGPASTIVPGTYYQPFAQLNFELRSHAPAGPGSDVLLLSGVINLGALVASGDTAGAASPSGVTYTGGAILAAAGSIGSPGSFSMSMINVSPVANVGGVGAAPFISEFTADATGLFNIVPEPTSLGLLAVGALATLSRKRK